MTIYDIAKQAGVSASTVSRVINNKPGINAQTRKRVQKLLNENHYTPNEAARGLVMQSSKIIGILIEDLRIEHHTESAYVIEQEMTALGYTCITLSTGRKDEKKADYIRILEQRRVDGAILMGSMFETEAVKKSIEEHLPDIPVAIVNGYLDLPNVYGVLIDEERGVKDCAELMLKKGKKHLVMAVDSDTPSNRNKQKGYIRAMTEQGIAKKDILLYTAINKEFTNPRDVRAAGAKLTEQILTERPETDGIIYTTDLLAVGGLEAAKKMGCWQENDAYVPSPGDAILYDWQDNGIGDNTGNPDHVGTVIEIHKESGYMVIEEGNYSNAVKKRTLSINGKFIRGFITPKYDDNTVAAPGLSKDKDIKPTKEMIKVRHKLVYDITTRLESFSLNTVISAFMEHTNTLVAIAKKEGGVDRDTLDTLAVLLAPFAPHMAEEIWEELGNKESVFRAGWPKYDTEAMKDDEIEIPVQINGKTRAVIKISAEATKEEAIAAGKEAIADKLTGNIVKEIYVPKKIINIVQK